MDDTEEDGSFLATTPQDDQRCTRLTGCKNAECLTCNKTGTGTHHVRDFSQEKEGTVTHNFWELSQELYGAVTHTFLTFEFYNFTDKKKKKSWDRT